MKESDEKSSKSMFKSARAVSDVKTPLSMEASRPSSYPRKLWGRGGGGQNTGKNRAARKILDSPMKNFIDKVDCEV
jgi:hypothetical protein